MHREISSLEQRLNSLRSAAVGGGSYGGGAAAPARRGPGRPPGRRGPGRPPGRRGPGRPPRSAAQQPAPAAAPAAGAAATGRKRGRRRRSSLSAEQLASRQLQGRYLGLIRQIPASRRGQYQKIAKESGREAAIKAMQDTLKK